MVKYFVLALILILHFSCKTRSEKALDKATTFVQLIKENNINEAEKLIDKDYFSIEQKSRPELIGEMLFVQNKIKDRKFDKNKFIIENDESTVCFLFDDLTLYVNLIIQNNECFISNFAIM